MLDGDNTTAIILCGGSGTRLFPLTSVVNKHFLPIYSKPMIYYPVSLALMLGLRKLVFVCNPNDTDIIRSQFKFFQNAKIEIEFVLQKSPKGISHAVNASLQAVKTKNILVFLGDNLFFGHNIIDLISLSISTDDICKIFTYEVKDPTRFGVVYRNKDNSISDLIEKPVLTNINEAVTGLYFMNTNFFLDAFNNIQPSKRNELEITSVLNFAVARQKLKAEKLPKGSFWVDAGLISDFFMASEYVRSYEERTGSLIYCPEEIVLKKGLIDRTEFYREVQMYPAGAYKDYLLEKL